MRLAKESATDRMYLYASLLPCVGDIPRPSQPSGVLALAEESSADILRRSGTAGPRTVGGKSAWVGDDSLTLSLRSLPLLPPVVPQLSPSHFQCRFWVSLSRAGSYDWREAVTDRRVRADMRVYVRTCSLTCARA
eukprot:6186601-Pleurochrysis_carterae.AAC.2